MKLSHTLLPAALVGALLLTGCTGGSPSKDAKGDACLAGGEASESIEVKGKVGDSLELVTKTPIEVKKTQRTVLEPGEGEALASGQTLNFTMTAFNGANGDVIEQVPATPITYDEASMQGWILDAVRCATPGQKVALVTTYAEVFGEADPAQLPFEGMTAEDSLVIVMKFGKKVTDAADGEGSTSEPGTLDADKLLSKAEGKAKKAPEGFPTVELAKDGEPTITIPDGIDPPSKLSIATLIQGDGEEVKDGDRVYVNYRGVIWRTGEEFDSSWSRGAPTDFVTTGVIGGFQEALVGQKVGSQVIAVVPAEDGGYGADALEQMGHKGDDVMVFVLDILGTVHP